MSNVDASILYNFGLYSQSIPSEILRRIETLESTVENLKSELAIQKADNCKLRSEIHNLQTQLEGLEDLRPWTEALSKKVNRLATKPKVEGSKAEEHIEELYQVMKKNSLPSLSFSNAAKFLGLSKGRVKQLKALIVKDGRFDIIHATGHKQKLMIVLRSHGHKTG